MTPEEPDSPTVPALWGRPERTASGTPVLREVHPVEAWQRWDGERLGPKRLVKCDLVYLQDSIWPIRQTNSRQRELLLVPDRCSCGFRPRPRSRVHGDSLHADAAGLGEWSPRYQGSLFRSASQLWPFGSRSRMGTPRCPRAGSPVLRRGHDSVRLRWYVRSRGRYSTRSGRPIPRPHQSAQQQRSPASSFLLPRAATVHRSDPDVARSIG